MVHMANTYRYDLWLQNTCNPMVEISCLMPNGVFIPLEVNKDATLHEIKEDLFEEATKFPLVGILHDSSSYIFSCVNSMAEGEELVDEAKRLSDVRPFVAVLKIIERSPQSDDTKFLHQQISHLIGKGLHEFDALKSPEVNYFRWKMRALGDEMASLRTNKSWLERLCCQYPPRVAPANYTLTTTLTNKMPSSGRFHLYVTFPTQSNEYGKKTMSILWNTRPDELVVQALSKRPKGWQGDPSEYILKVVGQEEYLIGDYPLVQFLYIQEALVTDSPPSLLILHTDKVLVAKQETRAPLKDSNEDMRGSRNSFSTLTLRKRDKLITSWKINDKFTFQVSAACQLNCDTSRTVEVVVQAGLFHGGKSLCETQKTCEKTVTNEGHVSWHEDLQFDIKVSDIPRMTRLCFVVYEVSKSSKGLKSRKIKDYSVTTKQDVYINPIGWVNLPVFDFKHQLRTGAMSLYMWTYAEDSQTDDLFHPLGTVVSNPNIEHSTALTVLFHKYHPEHTVVYPSLEKVLDTCKSKNFEADAADSAKTLTSFEQIRALTGRDPLEDMHEQEKKEVWAQRYRILREAPELLPSLLDSVEWNNHHQVCEVMYLLEKWTLLAPVKAMELLDFAYADYSVRRFAVNCLSKLTDDDLSLYLLQLVQALKHENYLHCDLVEFLLRRALKNQKIGHFLFWHLRSEMHVSSVWVRFGLMLEAYCHGHIDHMKALSKQVSLLSKLRSFSEEVRTKPSKDKARAWLHETLSQQHIREYIEDVLNPLDPSYRFKHIRWEKCKVMDSKMRPLWLVMENWDELGSDVYLLFKNGDDLRQDMLTLQMIRLMDRLWKNEGLDLRMNPYGCISTDNRVGLIEVVLNAETIANIQKEKGMFSATCAFKKGSLLAWLKDHNSSEGSLMKAIEEFTYSCAGYCVATYVLGVADRHSDNIMVKKTGQLFHIDFGHILGHFKEKFGFRRERVPFVLTHDFVHVINKGQTLKKDRGAQPNKFEIFQKLCEEAFLILRKHGKLILSLFAMMISTGLPELSSEQDLTYLRETLVLELCEADARAHFRSKFDEALSNSWKTSLHWASHNMAKNNKV